jgi:UDP-glucose 4-epimerase
MPYVCQVAAGMRECLNVFGSDYPTRDGAGVRDYIHVCDLARAHVDAIDALFRRDASLTVNLGTGRGYSVLEVVKAFERASGRAVPVKMMPRRAGDVAECYADPALAKHLLGWQTKHGLEKMCEDAWRWQENSLVD